MMKKKIAALLLMICMAVPTGTIPVPATEPVATEAGIGAETGGSETAENQAGASGETIEGATESEGQLPAGGNATAATESDSTISDVVSTEPETEAVSEATEAETELETEEDLSTDLAASGNEGDQAPYDLSTANPKYRDMEWDAATKCYRYIDEDGSELLLDPNDPEFYAYVFGSKGRERSGGSGISSDVFGISNGRGHGAYQPAQMVGSVVKNGIDVSHHQGNINWAAAKADGVEFAIIRVAYTGTTSTNKGVDTKWVQNVQGAAAAGIPNIGLYYYSQAMSPAEAVAEAQTFLALVNSSGLGGYINMPLYMDYEYGEGSGTLRFTDATISKDVNYNQSVVNTFCATIQSAGYQSGVYANSWMIQNRLNVSLLQPNAKLWIARFSQSLDYGGSIDMWQYSSVGAVGGISGYVDLDYWYQTPVISISPANTTLTLDESKATSVSTSLKAVSNSTGMTYAWAVSGTGAALNSTTGNAVTLTATKPGQYTITLAATVGQVTKKATATVIVKAALQDSWFPKEQIESITYDGKAHALKDSFTILDTASTKAHTKNEVTYTIAAEGASSITNVKRDANGAVAAYDVTITGSGFYTGTVKRTITIDPKDIGGEECTVIPEPIQEYVSSPSDIQIAVRDNGIAEKPVVLTRNTDYEVLEILGLSAEDTQVKVGGIGNYTGTAISDKGSLLLEPSSLSDSMITPISDQFYTGAALEPVVTLQQAGVYLLEGTDYEISSSSYSNNINLGTATVTVTGKGNFKGTATTTFKIKAQPLSNEDVVEVVAVPDQPYTAAAIKLDSNSTVLLRNKVTGQPLKEGTDYRFTYSANTNVGTAKLTFTGLGNYNGTVKGSFNIVKKEFSDGEGSSDVRIYLANSLSYAADYTGKDLKPAVKVTRVDAAGKEKTVPASQYTVTYTDNRNVGTATVTITGKGSYSGTKTATFTIQAKALTDLSTGKAGKGISFGNVAAQTYTIGSLTPLPTVKYSGLTLTAGTDYTVTYDSVELNGKEITVKQAGLSAINKAGTYRVVLTAASPNFSGSFTYTNVFKVNPAKLTTKSVMLANTALPLRNGRLTDDPGLLVSMNNTALTSDDYRTEILKGKNTYASFGSITEPGRYTVKVTGTGNYTGTVSLPLDVIDTSDGKQVLCTTDYEIILPDGDTYDFNNGLQKPMVRVSKKTSGTILELNKDYTVAYTNNKNAGIATVKVTGKGNYKGTLTRDFTITSCINGTIKVTLNKTSFVFNGKVQKATPTVKLITTDASGKEKTLATLRNKTDYTFTYENADSHDAGTYQVFFAMSGNYGGSTVLPLSYTIIKLDASKLSVTVPTQYYNGSAREPALSDLKIRAGGVLLTDADKEGLDISYAANTALSGTANKPQVILKAKENGNFTGSKTQNFTITRHALTAADLIITVSGNDVVKNVSSYSVTYMEELVNEKLVAKEQKPEVKIVDTSRLDAEGNPYVLTANDYKVTYSNNKNAGTKAAITLTGLGGYSGSRKVTFTILGKDITDTTVTMYQTAAGAKKADEADKVDPDTTYTYTGAQLKPTPVVTWSDAENEKTVELKSGTDYTVKYVDNINAGEAKLILTGKGRFAGTKEITYRIAPVTKEWVKANKKTIVISNIAAQNYTGKNIIPNVTVTVAGKKLTRNKDYTLNVTNCEVLTETKTATLMVNGINNYKGLLGSKDFTMTIPTPAAPTVTSPSTGKVCLSWKQVNGVNAYRIEYSEDAYFNEKTIETVSGDLTTKTLDAASGKTLYFRIYGVVETEASNGKTRTSLSNPSLTRSVKVK